MAHGSYYSLTLTFISKVKDLTFVFANISLMVRDRANITIAIRYEVTYLPSNGTTASVVHHDLDIHFYVTKFEM